MYALGNTSKARLSGVHPHLVRVVNRAITLTGQDFSVLEGVRSIETQREYVRKGASRTMASRHLKGSDGFAHAVDLVAYIGMPRWEWALYPPIADAMRRAAILEAVPIRWGGHWGLLNDLGSLAAVNRAVAAYVARKKAAKQKAFLDGPHFELPASACYP